MKKLILFFVFFPFFIQGQVYQSDVNTVLEEEKKLYLKAIKGYIEEIK